MIMAVTFAAFTVLYSKLQTEDEVFRRVLLSASLNIQKDKLHAQTATSKNPWLDSATLVNQIFSGQRFALLSLDERRRKVADIHLHNVEQEAVIERRREIRRSPYADAISQRRPLRITASETWRPFFEISDDERQLIVALQSSGINLGFLVLGVTEEFENDHPDTMELARSVALRVSEFLRNTTETEVDRTTSPADYLQLRGGRLLSRTVARMGEVVGRRLDDMEHLLDRIGTATVVYDLFGNVVYSNKSMSKLLESTTLKPYELPAAAFLAELTGLSKTQAAARIREAIVSSEQTQLDVTAEIGGPNTNYFVNLRTITDADEKEGNQTESIATAGLIFEIVDLAGSYRSSRSRHVVTRHLDYELRSRLGSLSMAAGLLRDKGITPDLHTMLLDELTQNIQQAIQVLDISQAFFQDDDPRPGTGQAADPADVLSEVDAIVRQIYTQQNVQLCINRPTFTFLIRSNIDELVNCLVQILKIMASDTPQDGVVRLDVHQQLDELVFVAQNEGFGIPEQQLMAYLVGTDQNASAEYRGLRSSLVSVQKAGTRIRATSSVGKGMLFKLSVPRVLKDG